MRPGIVLLCFAGCFLYTLGAQGDDTAAPPTPKSNHPVNIFHWSGPQTGGSGSGYTALATGDNDEYDKDSWSLNEESVKKLRQCDIAYIFDHGGRLQTWPTNSQYKFVDLNFPTANSEGPSLVMAWGCENARADLITKYARGLGVLSTSKTKVYIGPKLEPDWGGVIFQDNFFELFSKGDVTVEEAARKAYEKLRSSFYGVQTGANAGPTFEEFIGILGNGKLTLNQIRANLDTRDRMRALLQSRGLVGLQRQILNWYCTNRPAIESTFPKLDQMMRGNLPRASAAECQLLVKTMKEYWESEDMDTTALTAFDQALLTRINKMKPGERLPPFLQSGGLAPTPPAGAAEQQKWRDDAARAALAWWGRTLATDQSQDIRRSLKPKLEALQAMGPEVGQTADAAIKAVIKYLYPDGVVPR